MNRFLTNGRVIEIGKYYLCYHRDNGELCKIIMVNGGYSVVCYYWEDVIITGDYNTCYDWMVKHFYE